MTDKPIVNKIGWCFTCDSNYCQHIKDATQELINALQRKEEEDYD
jgi:hypothetical protein